MTGKVFSAALLAVCLGAATMSQVPDQPDAQAAPPRSAAQAPAITIPLSAGTAINASLATALDSTHSKPGDAVSAMVRHLHNPSAPHGPKGALSTPLQSFT